MRLRLVWSQHWSKCHVHAWSPYLDPRLDALADAYALLGAAARDADQSLEVAR